VTLATWVRVDSLPNTNNSLMMSDSWPLGALHWQIGDSGTIILGIRGPRDARNAHYHAPKMFGPERFGQWTHLAVVYDRENGQVSHYLDGQLVAQEHTLFDIPLRIGDAELGNWNTAPGRAKAPIRYLNGCMDEFAAFARALGEAEIEQLYSRGRPPM